jgi:hypothetical protein
MLNLNMNKNRNNQKVLKSGFFPGDWILLKAFVLTICAIGMLVGGLLIGKEAIVNYQIFYEIVTKGTTALLQEIHTTTTPGIPVEIVTEILTIINASNMSAEEQFQCLVAIKKNLIMYQQENINKFEILEAHRLQQLINLFEDLSKDQLEAIRQLQKFLKQFPKSTQKGTSWID